MIRVHDDVLRSPLAYRQMALLQRFQTVTDGGVAFQGIAPCPSPEVPDWLVTHFPDLRPTLSFFRLSPHGQAEPHYIHDDRSMGQTSAILYLNPHPLDGDGTIFWRHRITGATAATATARDERIADGQRWADASQWEIATHVAAKFGRLVIFDAACYHSRALPENYGETDADARLIHVIFSTGALA